MCLTQGLSRSGSGGSGGKIGSGLGCLGGRGDFGGRGWIGVTGFAGSWHRQSAWRRGLPHRQPASRRDGHSLQWCRDRHGRASPPPCAVPHPSTPPPRHSCGGGHASARHRERRACALCARSGQGRIGSNGHWAVQRQVAMLKGRVTACRRAVSLPAWTARESWGRSYCPGVRRAVPR